nr:MAG TPA: hypothetical protein [Caudoviricetes sp.]
MADDLIVKWCRDPIRRRGEIERDFAWFAKLNVNREVDSVRYDADGSPVLRLKKQVWNFWPAEFVELIFLVIEIHSSPSLRTDVIKHAATDRQRRVACDFEMICAAYQSEEVHVELVVEVRAAFLRDDTTLVVYCDFTTRSREASELKLTTVIVLVDNREIGQATVHGNLQLGTEIFPNRREVAENNVFRTVDRIFFAECVPISIRTVAGDCRLKCVRNPTNSKRLEFSHETAEHIRLHIRLIKREPLIVLIACQPELNFLQIKTIERFVRPKDKVEFERFLVIVHALMDWLDTVDRARFDNFSFRTKGVVFVFVVPEIADVKAILR